MALSTGAMQNLGPIVIYRDKLIDDLDRELEPDCNQPLEVEYGPATLKEFPIRRTAPPRVLHTDMSGREYDVPPAYRSAQLQPWDDR